MACLNKKSSLNIKQQFYILSGHFNAWRNYLSTNGEIFKNETFSMIIHIHIFSFKMCPPLKCDNVDNKYYDFKLLRNKK
jgi:hypothetical protein